MIYIVAGHRGGGTGARHYIDEGAETISLANHIAVKLRAAGIDTWRDTPTDSLTDVVQQINRLADGTRSYCVDIHFNSSTDTTAHGTEAYVANVCSNVSIKLASALTKCVCRTLGTSDRTHGKGYRRESASNRKSLYFVEHTVYPAVILEVCFCSNYDDVTLYKDRKEELASAIADTINSLLHSY